LLLVCEMLSDTLYPSMNQVTTFFSPRKIVFGPGSRRNLGEEIRSLGGSKILVVTYLGAAGAASMAEIVKPLESDGAEISVYDKAEPEPRIEVAEDLAEYTRAAGFDLIVGLGGGSVMDLAKIASMSTASPGQVRDYLGVNLVSRRGAPLICMPTTSGTGSEVTMFSVLTVNGRKMDVVSPHILPDVALIDPVLTVTMPPEVTAGTGMDALSQAIETVTSLASTPLTDALALKAVQLAGRALRVAYAEGGNLKVRCEMALAATLSGLAFGSGKLTLGHSLAQTFGPLRKIPHGVSCGIALPYVMEFYLPVIPEKLRLIAEALGAQVRGMSPSDAGLEAIRLVKNLAKDLGIPSSLREVGFDKGELPLLAETCVKEWPRPNSPRELTTESVLEVLERMWHGKDPTIDR
jgi:alcohol dehydrogenase class IV